MRLIIIIALALLLAGCAITGRISGVPNEFASGGGLSQKTEQIFDGKTRIFVSSENPESLARKFARLDRLGVLQEIYRIGAKDNGVLTARNREQSVIFVIWDDVAVGSKVRTSFTYSRSKKSVASKPTDKPFTAKFVQTVQEDTNIYPLIIINSTFSIFKGDFTYRITVNGKTTERKIVVPNDAAR